MQPVETNDVSSGAWTVPIDRVVAFPHGLAGPNWAPSDKWFDGCRQSSGPRCVNSTARPDSQPHRMRLPIAPGSVPSTCMMSHCRVTKLWRSVVRVSETGHPEATAPAASKAGVAQEPSCVTASERIKATSRTHRCLVEYEIHRASGRRYEVSVTPSPLPPTPPAPLRPRLAYRR